MRKNHIKTSTARRAGIALFGIFFALCIAFACLFISEEVRLNRLQQDALQELEADRGTYDEHTIVLYDTTRSEAEALAEKFGAKLRITSDGKFATLTLAENITVYDVYSERANRAYLPQLSLDYFARISEEEEGAGERLPSPPDYAVTDGYYDRQTYLDYLNIGEAWNYTQGSGITVAVIDTGIDTDHPEFAGRISEYSYNATEDKIVKDYTLDDGSYDWSLIEDEQGHGTAVAGVVAAAMNGSGTVGVAPQAEILVIKAECDENGTFYSTSDLVFGLYYAIEQDVDVVNMSFGTYYVNPFASATKLAKDSDIVCVAAAGNDGTSALCYPAADENVIGVGALAQESWELASYSNYGENADMVAPGTVYTAKKGGGYGVMNGTSFASPAVAGAVALYLSRNVYADVAEVKELLYASSYDLGGLGSDWYFGYGALDINALICEERGTVTFNMLTDELENTERVFIRNHTLQNLPEPERLYAVFDGWYFDIECTEELQWYEDVFTSDLTLYAHWVNEEDGVPYTYVTLDDGTVEIRGYMGHRRYITIPDTIEGKIVSSIGDFAFDGENGLRQVNLPAGLTNIGAYAFRDCSNLLSVSVPSGVTEIGEYAFYNTVRLSSAAFGEGSRLQTVGEFAFAYSGLSRFELPAEVTDIDGSAFYGATSLTDIGVREGNTAFASVGGILYNYTQSTLIAYPAGKREAYTAPATLWAIGNYAFAYTRLTEAGLGSVQTIGGRAFAYSALERMIIPDMVTNMGAGAFEMNFNLREVVLGGGLTSIPDYAFFGCSALSSVHIPANIVYIASNAFAMCVSLSEVTFAEGSNLTQIGSDTFAYSALTEIALPDSLVMIGDKAFVNNYNLSSVAFGENSTLQVIGDRAFAYAYSLEQIDLPKTLQRIGGFAFLQSGLRSVGLPASLIQLDAGAFAACGSLAEITVESGNESYKDIDGVVYDIDATEIVAYPEGKDTASYIVADSVTKIGDAAFYGANKLTSIQLPSGLETVGAYGFYACTGIRTYALPQTLTYIEEYAFSQNTSLTNLAIPDAVYQIGRYAFADDYALRSVTFTENSALPRISYGAFAYTGLTSFRVPASVSTIAQDAFLGNSYLTSVTFAANSSLESISAYMFKGSENLRTITFEEGSALTSIQAHGLEGMSSLTSVDFGDAKITNIDNYAFRYDENLVDILLPSTVEYIGRYAFYGCTALARLDLPETIEYIGRYAFYGAEGLDVYFAGDELPLHLQENWDAGIRGYYVGVSDVVTSGDWSYAVLNSSNISIVQYSGTQTQIDLTSLDFGGDIVSIGGYAFYNTPVTDIVLPDTLTSIQAYVFARSGLRAVSIPANVEYIARYAFFHTPLESVIFAQDSALKVMEQWAFAYTRELNTIEIPASLQTMGSNAFYHSGITNVTFAADSALTEIPESAFASSALVSVALPDSVTLINHNAFRDCTYLQSVDFGGGADLRLMSNVFYNTGLTSLHIPANLTYIGEYAFVGLQALEEFTADENNPEYSVADGILYNKDVSKIIAVPAGRTGSLTLPETLETIGFGAFENSSLEEISFDENSNILSIGYRAFYGADALTEITIPASVVSIDYYAFAMCESLETVIFAEGSMLTGVYEGAFYGCTRLKNILLPDSVREISDFAFYGCTSLTELPVSETNRLLGIYSYAFAYTGIEELTLPETLVDLGEYAFRGARLTKVVIPGTNREQLLIGIGAFADCGDLSEITLPFIGASFEDTEITWFGYIFGAGGYEANSTYVPASLQTVTLSEGITFIGAQAFRELPNIQTINIPHSVRMVYNYAFYNCLARYEFTNTISIDGMELGSCYFSVGLSGNLVLAEGITSIWSAFAHCSGLTGIEIPSSVTSLGSSAFWYCCGLTSIEIPSGVTSIGEYVFNNCNRLAKVIFEEDSQLMSIGAYAFNGCSDLTGIEIPSGVTSIGEYVFNNCNCLSNVIFEEDSRLMSLGAYAFNGCSDLTGIEIPSGVTDIGTCTFNNCSSLTAVTFGKNSQLTSIGSFAFNNCSRLISIEIPNGVTTIGNSAFDNCSSLKSVTFGENSLLRCIGMWTFQDCKSLRSITFGENSQLASIGIYAFENCSSLTNIEIPSKVTSIRENTFIGCSSLISVTFGENSQLTSIEYNAFYNCSSLTSVTFGENSQLTSIGNNAFSNCNSLMGIEIPSGVTSIGEGAFSHCNKLYQVTNFSDLVFTIGSTDYGFVACYARVLTDKNGNKTYIDAISDFTYIDTAEGFRFMVEDKEYRLIAYFGREDTVTLPEYINEKTYTIYRMFGVKNVILPNNMTSIGESAFYNCNSLTSIEIPDSVMSIEGYAFYGCNSLTSIEIPGSVTSIGDYAFFYCSSLTGIEIPSGITRIGDSAFAGCSSLTAVTFGENSQLTSIGAYAFNGCNSLTSIEIPDSVTSIGGGAFSGCSSLTSIEIPDSVTSIGGGAFSGCSSLTSIEIPDSVTSIGGGAFSGCNSLTDFNIHSKNENYVAEGGIIYNKAKTQIVFASDAITDVVISATVTDITNAFSDKISLRSVIFPAESRITSIGYGAFYNCSSLTSIEIPNSVTSIGGSAFLGCCSLTSVTFGENSQLSSIESFAFNNCNSLTDIEIPNGVTSIGSSAFNNCNSLTGIEIPNGVTSIGGGAFQSCSSLTNIEIPSGVTSIGYGAFTGCSSLTSVAFGENSQQTSIGGGAFQSCSSLTSISIPSGIASIGIYAFRGCSSLTNIQISSSVTSIGSAAFDRTAYYNDASNWENGCLYIGNHLIAVDADTEYFEAKENIGTIASDAFEDCYQLTYAEIGGNHANIFSSLTNLETLVITEMPTYNIYRYFGYNVSDIPITLRTIVLKEGVQVRSRYAFQGITGVTIYAEVNEQDVMWDDDYPNWINGNPVYYGGEWITAVFRGADGSILDSGYYLTSQVIRQPYYKIGSDERYDYTLVGWDLDGDGIADAVPATSAQDIIARAVVERSVRVYTIVFLDKDGVTPLYTYTLPYGEAIPAPVPEKRGYIFLGWEGYTDGMTATEDMAFHSVWQHEGEGHVYGDAVIVPPDCTERGYTKHTCTICGEWYATDYTEAAGHSFGELLTEEATCTEDGCTYYLCSVCGEKLTESVLGASGHDFGEWIVEREASCLRDGLRYHVCGECGLREEEVISAAGHSYTGIVTGESSCEEYGEISYVCEYCGDTVRERLDKTEHHYVKKYVPKSWLRWLVETLLNIFFGYEGDNGYYFECVDCRHIQTSEEAMMGASVQSVCLHATGEETLVLEETCELQGVYGRYCTVCGELVEARTVAELGHDYIASTVPPTCSEYGYTLHECSHCGDYYITDIVDKVAHTPGEWIVDVEADCTHAGSRHTECSVCGEILQTEVIEATGHKYGGTQTVAATCEQAGYTYHVCTECGAEERLSEIPALNHTPGEWIVDVEADCTHNGNRHTECTVCGEILQAEVIEATGHKYGGTQTVAATCEQAGYTYRVCTECALEERLSEIPVLNHTPGEWIVDVEADCTHAGSRHTTCTVCGEILQTEVIQATRHKYGDTQTVASTCEQTGYAYHVCTECGAEERLSEIPVLNHTSGEWIIDVEADCTHNGSKHTECTVCGDILQTKVIEALGHSYDETQTVAATCEQAGYTYHVCTECGAEERLSEIPALNHTPGEWIVDVEADCAHAGSQHTECTVCGEILQTEVIEATGHNYGEVQTVAATCEQAGYTYRVCTECALEERLSEIPALNHTPGEWIVDVEADCTHAGSQHIQCTVCDEILQTEVIQATGHSYGEIKIIEATCEEVGYAYYICEICGDKRILTEPEALGHTPGEWIIDVEADCTHNGNRHTECTVCGEILQTEVIQATRHKYGDTQTVASTCEQTGYAYHVCTECGAEERLSEIPALNHTPGEWIVDVEADCTHAGSRHIACTICGEILQAEVIQATGHKYGETQTVAATCEQAEYTYHICETCGAEERLSEIPALGHTPGEWMMDHETEERYIICITCGEELLREAIAETLGEGMRTGTVVLIVAGSAVGVGGCSGLIVWLILRRRKGL